MPLIITLPRIALVDESGVFRYWRHVTMVVHARISPGVWAVGSLVKIGTFWDVAPCSLRRVERRFRFIALMMEAVRTSETSVYSKETTWRYIPEESNIHTRCREILKSHTGPLVVAVQRRSLSPSKSINESINPVHYYTYVYVSSYIIHLFI
jgi:hypothetical protein